MQTSNGSVISQSHMSLASSSTVESTCADELEEREEDEEKLATAIEEGESTTNESTDTHFAHDYTDNNNSNESEEEHDEYVEREIIPPLRWFSWKLPTLWRSSHTETLNDSNNA
uniref:Uncharacterized protein n=1 Tax=Parascaris univalens TaxID=6257 RepID=A0A915BXD7_PARUN